MSQYLDFALQLSTEAANVIKNNFTLGISQNSKADRTPVTEIDRQINKLVIDRIKEAYPEHSIIGEEQNHTVKDSKFNWVCDPIDGTIAFANGIPTSVFSLGLLEGNKAICGVIVDPFTNRVFHAEKGQGAFLNGQPIHVTERDNLDGTVIGMTPWKDAQFNAIPMIQDLQDQNAFIINLTSYANVAMLVASGQLSAAIYIDNKLHDIYPAALIVEEAGGIATDLRGDIQDYEQPIIGQIVTSKPLAKQIVDILKI